MRRLLAIVGAMIFAVGIVGVIPASATHCGPNNATSCSNPITITMVEGVGKVCTAADATDPCTYDLDDPTWVGKPVFQHWAGSQPKQGLYWPGVGPGAEGPYKLKITKTPGTVNPGQTNGNVCVSNIGGAGCGALIQGDLTAGASGVGAHCGSSEGTGTIEFDAAGGLTYVATGTLGWSQSAATILPTVGQISKINGASVNPRPSIIGFSSSRGAGGEGNCGTTTSSTPGAPGGATTGFNVEGMTVTY